MTRVAAALCALLVSTALRSWAQGPAAGVCYEVFVRSFYDSDGDGIGDLRGLIEKLPYLTDLGASCIWLMPIAQSPSYHGYDVTNYYQVDRDYGTTEDFKRLIAEAHRRGIRVLVDLVLNHVSSEHPYFRSALFVPGSPYRDWFRWSATHPGGDNWHRSPVRDEYYYGFFWSGMPDLNFETPAVREEAQRVARFWLQEMGVDGFRLDAVRHLVEEGAQVSNTAGTHAVLREFAAYVRGVAPGSFTIGEVWDSTGTILRYYPDQLDAYFIFEVADALVDAVRTASSHRLIAAVQRAQRDLPPGRWASFLRNHDQTRTLTELQGDGVGGGARARLAATLLLTLPGIPFVYYGEEIGMTGSKPDPRLRTPMHWARKEAAGFTDGTPWEPLQPDSFTANVEAQEGDANSLLNLYRRLIHLRAARPALGSSADFIPLTSGTDTVLAYLRRADGKALLVVANLSGRTRAGPALSSLDAVLPPGRYTVRALFGRGGGAGRETSLRVTRDGRIRGWIPLATLDPFESYILELNR